MIQDQNKGKPGDPDYFACTCSDAGKEQCRELLKEVQKLLEADDSNMLTKIVFSLNFEYAARITSVLCDQWCGIESKTFDYAPAAFSTDIQCDSVEDGIAATWLAYYKKFGKKTSWIEA